MKRFRSPFLKIQRIQQQQLRLAELNLARVQAALSSADRRLRQLQQQAGDSEQDAGDKMASVTDRLRPEMMQAMRAHVDQCRDTVQQQQAQCEQLRSEVIRAQTVYRELKARCDGIDRLIQQKQNEHRRQAVQIEQIELDESARILGRRTGLHALDRADAGNGVTPQ